MVLPTSLAALRRLASLWVRRAEFTIDEVAFNLFVGQSYAVATARVDVSNLSIKAHIWRDGGRYHSNSKAPSAL